MSGEMVSDLGRQGQALAAADCLPRDEREEAAWLQRARTGDEAAYRWLLGRYRARVVRLAAHVLRREGEAEDVAQEAFLRAFRRLPGFRGEGRFSAWLFGIAVRLCLDRRRSARWTCEVPKDDAPAPFPSPNSAEDSTDTRLLVEALLDRLSPPMRAALVLRELEGLDYDEIAATLGVPVGTVRSRLHTARAQFRALWTAVLKEDEDRFTLYGYAAAGYNLFFGIDACIMYREAADPFHHNLMYILQAVLGGALLLMLWIYRTTKRAYYES